MTQELKQGAYTLLADCPECGLTVHFPVELSARLTVDDQGSSLRPLLRVKSKDHACGNPDQQSLPFLTGRQ